MERKAFIAAPLLGTIIFLAAILFVVHVGQSDKAEVSKIVSDAYHNRIVTILDNYRSDMKAIFSVSIARSIESFLTAQCWSLFTISNAPEDTCGPIPPGVTGSSLNLIQNPSVCPNPSKPVDYKKASLLFGGSSDPNSISDAELRYFKCVEATDIIKQGVCGVNKAYGITAWLNLTTLSYSFEGVDFTLDPASKDAVGELLWTTYCDVNDNGGLDPENGDILVDTPCVGPTDVSCSFRSAPSSAPDSCRDKNGASHKLRVNYAASGLCSDLVGEFLFDCSNFAKNKAKPFQCCKPGKFESDGSCKAENVLPGCEDGTFFINVNVAASEELFKKMPRIVAQDKFGNALRSGAVGDEAFLVQVKYPFYQYYDLSFNTFDKFAYKTPATPNVPGVVDGYCVGKGCKDASLNSVRPAGKKFTKAGRDAALISTDAEAKKKVSNTFFDDFIRGNVACKPFEDASKLRLYLQSRNLADTGYDYKYLLCDENAVTDFSDKSRAGAALGSPTVVPLSNPDSTPLRTAVDAGLCSSTEGSYCGFIDSLAWSLEVEDKRPQFLTDQDGNRFCFQINPKHFSP
ncbi:hypothetical protein HY993_00980 [Candidatus Micrarchaeota archaeon]|nr:hypothetical protein [Candidatus Micrarchaeota archaeon]